jgi:hypothetical protein
MSQIEDTKVRKSVSERKEKRLIRKEEIKLKRKEKAK